MNIKTTLAILFFCFFQNSWGQGILDPNMILKSGDKFEISKVFCENTDTLYFRLRGSLKYYKIAKSEINFLNERELNNFQIRHFSVRRDARFGILLERVGAIVTGSAISLTALVIVNANMALTWPLINACAVAGGVPGLVILIHAQMRANDYRAYRKAVELE